jgi:5-methylcytosine-specific restriction enzyme subunit McrC
VRRLSLREFRTEHHVPLTLTQREALRQLCRGIRIEPSPYSEVHYDITPDQRIGLIALPDLIVEIRPKVPMSSVLFLLSWACEAADWFDQQPEFAQDVDFVEIVAIMLARLVEKATHRGLLNGYRVEDEALQAPRGRILFDEQLRRRLGISPPVEVRHDIFTADILENRLLSAAVSAMSRMPLRSQRTRSELVRAQQLFGGVQRVEFSPAAVPDVRFTSLNSHYRSALSLASLVLRSASLDLGVGGPRGAALLINMNVVFEQFVRRALRAALDVDARMLPDRPPSLRLDEGGVVPLEPDLCIVDDRGVVWVGDAKYKRLPAGAYANADLYQLLAYTVALGLPGGTLIYAADQGVSTAEYVIVRSGKRLNIVALNLSAPPSAILSQVNIIASGIRSTVP